MKEKGNVAAAKHLEVAFFTLSVFPLFFSSPHVIVFCINPFTSPRASRRLVCFFFFTFFNPHLNFKPHLNLPHLYLAITKLNL